MHLIGSAGSWPDQLQRQEMHRYLAVVGGAAPSDSHRHCYAPILHEEDDIIVAVRGRISVPARELLQLYRECGTRLPDKLEGAFALAVIDRPRHRVLLAVDRMGIERLAYCASGDGITFSTSVRAIAASPAIAAALRMQSFFDFLLLHMIPASDTVFEGVKKLRPGSCVVYEQGRITARRYWSPLFPGSADASFDALKEELRDSLTQSVADCAVGGDVGAFLSGGLDSSTVAGLLGVVTGRPARTFSIGFGVESYNELEYAEIANRHFHSIPATYHVTPEDVTRMFKTVAEAFDEPFGNSSAVPTYFCAKLAADAGISHLLAGDGGDELFGGNERYARQRVFEAYWRIPSALRHSVIEPVSRLINPDSRLTPLRKLRSYVDQARIPMPERLESWNLMYRADLDDMLEPEFRRSIDVRAPFRAMAEAYGDSSAETLLDRMQWFDWQYTLSDNDLRKVGVMCELAGVRVSYPMLDNRVVNLSLRVPAKMKLSGLNLRTFYKRAMEDFLPAPIIAKRKHGFGLPFGVWLKSHAALAELITDLLADFKRRRILRASFIDGLIAGHRTGHASYFGYAIWDIAMLEAWLQTHANRTPIAGR